jgi:hypothetical protein
VDPPLRNPHLRKVMRSEEPKKEQKRKKNIKKEKKNIKK